MNGLLETEQHQANCVTPADAGRALCLCTMASAAEVDEELRHLLRVIAWRRRFTHFACNVLRLIRSVGVERFYEYDEDLFRLPEAA